MILKIRNKDPKNGISWKLIDGIKELDYEYMTLVKAEQHKEEAMNKGSVPSLYYRNFPIGKDCECVSCVGHEKRVCFIWLTKIDNTQLCILTDDTVYILNNNGKTVDGVYL